MKRYDERILNKLMDRYENSLLYSGKNQVNISISVPVQKSILPEYFDETSLQFDIIHEQLEALEEKGYIRLVWKNRKQGHILEKCVLVPENAQEIYSFLCRKPRYEKEDSVRNVCSRYMGKDEILDRFLKWVEKRLDEGESVRSLVNLEDPEEFERLCELIWRILTNQKECFLRQFSIQHFHDSKLAEKEIEKAAHVIMQFGALSCHAYLSEGSADLQLCQEKNFTNLSADEVLEEYNIYRNPSLVMMKGRGCFQIYQNNQKSNVNLMALPGGIGVTNQDMDGIKWSMEVRPDAVLTIENLTSFHQWNKTEIDGKSVLCIYLGGYHNRAKRQFLGNVYGMYPEAEYLHFGDIDCGGFRIWKDLCLKTGIPFQTVYMDGETYERYQEYGKSLTAQDVKTLERMKEDSFFEEKWELFEMMLRCGKKVEQECVEA